jgi:1-acyl-sn-glycerol-3-phosphate acyltransferase
VHFLADWNFRLIPGIGCLYARAQVVTVTRKSAKPRYLNALKPIYETSKSPLEQARAHLATGLSLGIFPEGKVNRDPTHLLRGRHGAARLSLESGVPVVPMGIRFASGQPEHLIGAGRGMELHIGAPFAPPEPALPRATLRAVTAWHAVIMTEIARLSGKMWQPDTKEAHNVQ